MVGNNGNEGDYEMNVTEALLKAILELIDKCGTIEELRASVEKIISKDK